MPNRYCACIKEKTMIDLSKMWENEFPAHRVFGNVYFIGTYQASSHIIDTGEGLIMLDSGLMETLYIFLSGMERLGLSPRDIKYIVHTHGHIDHFGATRALVELYGCKTFIGKEDAECARGHNDLSYCPEFEMRYDAFEPDVLLSDGDKIELGNTVITCYHTPGHTEGCMSYLFDVTDGSETFRAALHGGSGFNTLALEYLDKYGLNHSLREEFIKANERLAKEKVDIYLGNHISQNGMTEKYKKLIAGDKYAYVNSDDWSKYCLGVAENLRKFIAEGK